MSRRVGKGMRNKSPKEEKRPPSHVILENIQGMTHVMMCRGCGVRMFCQRPMQCEEEAKIEAKIAMISESMGQEEVKKLSPSQLAHKIREITDQEVFDFMRGVLRDVSMDSEPLQEGEKTDENEIDENEGEGEKTEDR